MGDQKSLKRKARISKPAVLKTGHLIQHFDCGVQVLNSWLLKHGNRAQENRTARTFVVCRGKQVKGYYSLAAGSVMHKATSGRMKRNSPDPIPVIILARLAIDMEEQGQGLGSSLLADSMRRALNATNSIGARALIVHAISEDVLEFYKSHGFVELTPGSPTLYIPIDTILKNL